MDRKIKFADVQKAVDEAYEAYGKSTEGQVDSRINTANDKAFGISVMLTDGRVINKGDTDVASPLGRISTLPEHIVLLQQNTPDELVGKSGVCRCNGRRAEKPQIPVSPHGVRAMSAIVPQNDPDGKWDVLMDTLLSLVGESPVLDDKLYENLKKQVAEADTVNKIARAGYELYDDATTAVDLYTRLESMSVTAAQAAALGATIAADGRNPRTGAEAFDGAIAANITSIAARGPHHARRAWMMSVGLPAANSFGGLIVAFLPGFGAIAAYSPLLDGNGLSVKAAKAIKYITNALQLNVYASARVDVEK